MTPIANGVLPSRRTPSRPCSRAMLMDRDAIMRAVGVRRRHDVLRRAAPPDVPRDASRSRSAASVVDPLTLADELERRGELDGGRRQGVHRLPRRRGADVGERRVPRAASSARRRCSGGSSRSRPRSSPRRSTAGSTAAELLDDAEQKIFQVASSSASRGLHAHQGAAVADDGAHRGAAARRRSRSPASPSGFHDLDELTSGFQPSDLDHRRRAPVDGKDGVHAQHRAARGDRAASAGRVLLARNEQGVARAANAHQRGAHRRAAAAQGHAARRRLPASRARGRHPQLAPIWIDDTPGITLLEMRSQGAPSQGGQGLGMVIVDYLQLMQGPANSENRQQEISQISRVAQGAGEGAARSGRRAVAALARARAAHRREQAAAAVRPARIRRHRAGRRPRHVHLPPRGLRRSAEPGQGRQLARGTRGDHRRQAAQRSDRHRSNLFFHKQYTRFENFTRRRQARSA